jgi:hypothetical protein
VAEGESKADDETAYRYRKASASLPCRSLHVVSRPQRVLLRKLLRIIGLLAMGRTVRMMVGEVSVRPTRQTRMRGQERRNGGWA